MGETKLEPASSEEDPLAVAGDAAPVSDADATLIPEAELEAALSEIENAANEIGQAAANADGSPNGDAAPPRAGDTSVSNAVASEDELAAALGGLEQMSEREVSEIPSLGDETPIEQTSSAADDSIAAPGAPPEPQRAGDTSESNALLPENELETALAEIEQMSEADAEDIPSLDEPGEASSADTDASQQQEAVESEAGAPTGAAESGAPAEEKPEEADSSPEDDAAATADDSSPEADAKPVEKEVRFAIGKKKAAAQAAEYTPPAERGDGESGQGGAPPIPDLQKRLLRMLDGVLDTVNHPLAGLSESTRKLVGLAALVTLVVSLSAMFILPSMLPRRDAISFLQEKRAKLDAPKPPRVAPDEPALED